MELKPRIHGQRAEPRTSFNRTSMELKRPLQFEVYRLSFPFNRTSMELKLVLDCITTETGFPFNRTSMELKPYNISREPYL